MRFQAFVRKLPEITAQVLLQGFVAGCRSAGCADEGLADSARRRKRKRLAVGRSSYSGQGHMPVLDKGCGMAFVLCDVRRAARHELRGNIGWCAFWLSWRARI